MLLSLMAEKPCNLISYGYLVTIDSTKMTNVELASVIIAGFSLLVSLIAVFLSGKANSTNKNMFRRQGVIDLHMAWQDIKKIDKQNLIEPDIIRAVNALSLTASLWNHDVIEKSILYQTYWKSYKSLYETLISIKKKVPGHDISCKSLITKEIKRGYLGMKNAQLEIKTKTYI